MSADNYAVCPFCLARAEEALAARRRDVDAAYGVVSVEEIDRMRDAAATDLNKRDFMTFREDWEIYLKDGVVNVHYSGWCSVCGSGTEFHDTHPVEEKVP